MSTASRILGLLTLLLVIVGALIAQLMPVRQVGERQGSYTTNAGELVGDALVGQTFVAGKNNLSAISIMFATYSGRDNTEPVTFHLRRSIEEERDLASAMVLPSAFGDNQFYRFEFDPLEDSAGQTFFFYVVSPQSEPGNAVTVDLDGRDPYHSGSAYLVRGQGVRVTDPAALGRAGKPTVDVAFETFYSVPLRVAISDSVMGAGRHFVTTWDEQRSTYALWGKVGAAAVVLLGLALVILMVPTVSVRWVLFILFGLALAVRLMYAAELPATNDEGNYLYDARTLLEGRLAGGDGYVKAPLVVAWVALWSFFDTSILVGRLSSVVIGALTIFPLYVLGREIGGKRTGLIAATLWALLGVTTVFNIYVHTQPLALFFGISGIAVLLMALRGTTPRIFSLSVPSVPAATQWFLLAGVLLGFGVVSRKSVLALGLVPLALIVFEGVSWRDRSRHLAVVGLGFLVVIGLLLGYAGKVYGVEGFWEALGVNSAEDGIAADPAEADQVRAYSLRGMTPFFREALPLIVLSMIGLGVVIERLFRSVLGGAFTAAPVNFGAPRSLKASVPSRKVADAAGPKSFSLLALVAKLGWVIPAAVFWWAWGFFGEYEGSGAMVFGMRQLWYAMAGLLVVIAVLPERGVVKREGQRRRLLTAVFFAPLWLSGLVFFYMNWIKFHANYIGEFLPPLVLLGGVALPALWDRVRLVPVAAVRFLLLVVTLSVLLWALFVSGYVTFVHEHTGTFQLKALDEAAQWAAEHIPSEEAIFTGAAAVPYLSGHHTALDIAHPRWYAYEFTRKDTERLNTFLPSAEEMVQAFRETEWLLLEKQTGFSFLMEYSEIEAGLERDFESVKGISNGSNTLTFYRRVRPAP